jgi:hypothetical protein
MYLSKNTSFTAKSENSRINHITSWNDNELYESLPDAPCAFAVNKSKPELKKSGHREAPGLYVTLLFGCYLNSLDLSTRSVWARLKQVHFLVSLSYTEFTKHFQFSSSTKFLSMR